MSTQKEKVLVKSTEILVPQHVAIISDGNRRWAKEKGLPSIMGHKKGVDNYEKLIAQAKKMGITCLTGWGFSTENWKRSEEEINYLFDLARKFTQKFEKKCLKEKIRFKHIGRKDRLPTDLVNKMLEMEEKTAKFTDFTFVAAVDYGGHDDILRAIKKVEEQGLEATEENIEKNLDTKDLPPVDLIIRTGGEKRLSGYLTWQSAYAELFFTDKFLPDFGPKDLEKAVTDFVKRDRRFGGDTKSRANTSGNAL